MPAIGTPSENDSLLREERLAVTLELTADLLLLTKTSVKVLTSAEKINAQMISVTSHDDMLAYIAHSSMIVSQMSRTS